LKTEPEKKIDKKEKVSSNGIFGGFIDFASQGLTTETTSSGKLLDANKEWVYRNQDVISKEVSTLELELFTVRALGGTIELTKIDQHPALEKIDRFNDSLSKSQAFYTTESHRILTGDAFWYLEGGQGDSINNIFLLDPTKVTLNLGDFTDSSRRLIKSYTYQDTVNGKPIKQTYEPEEIIHFKIPNPKNYYRGVGKVEAMQDTIDLDNMTNDLTKEFFKRGAITTGGALSISPKLAGLS